MHFLVLLQLLLIANIYQAGVSFANGNDKFVHENVRWSQLKYEASAFFVTAQTTIKLSSANKSEALQKIVKFTAEDLLVPQGDRLFNVDIFTDEFGRQTNYQVWFEESGQALQRKRITRGNRNQIKLTRYAKCGIYKLSKKFSNDKFDSDYGGWSKVKKKYKPYPEATCDGSTVVDSNALLYMVSALDLKDIGDQYELLLGSKKKPVKVKLVVKTKKKIKADYKISNASGKDLVNQSVEVLQVQLMAVADNENEKEDIELLGLHGKIYLYVDASNHLILRISGDTKYVKNLDVNLKYADMQ